MKQKIVFLRPGKLGDLIVATPFFSQLKKIFPKVHISVVCSPYNKVVIKHNPFVDEIKVVNFHSLFAVLGLIRWIKKQQFDWVIDLIPGVSRTSTIINRMVRSKKTRIAGMHKAHTGKFFDITTENHGLHIIDRNKLLIESVMQCKFTESISAEIHVLPEHRHAAKHILAGIEKNKIVIGINCSAGELERQWDRGNYHRLLELLHEKYKNIHTVLFSVNEQQKWAVDFSHEFKNTTALPAVDLFTVVAVMQQLSMFFSPDTSLIHIASGNGYPVVGLYCTDGENLVRWRAYADLTKELIACKTNSVNEISPEAAFSAIEEMMSIIQKKSAGISD